MKKKSLKYCGLLALALCFALLRGNVPVYASVDVVAETEVVEGAEVLGHECDIVVQGLEDVEITEITNVVTSSVQSSSCGIYHLWNMIGVLQEGNCDTQGIYRVQCINCGATGTVLTDAPGHNYVNGVCTNCGDCNVEVAPQAEINNWNYSINIFDKTISLDRYIGTSTDVIVYGIYQVDNVSYSTMLNCYGMYGSPFNEKKDLLTSIIIKDGVTCISGGYLFFECSNLTTLDISGLNTSNNRIMECMFRSCNKLTSLDLSNINTSNVINMYATFSGCSNLTTLDVNSFDTSKVVNMVSMFSQCGNLTALDLSGIDTSNVSTMNGMFSSCSSLTSLDLSNFNTSNVEGMFDMFSGCRNLTSLDLSNFNTSKVVNMRRMFYNCCNLATLNVSNFDTLNATDMDSMFASCEQLTTLDLSSFITYNVDDMRAMFYGCRNLITIYVNRFNWNTSFADTTIMFMNCGTSRVTPK